MFKTIGGALLGGLVGALLAYGIYRFLGALDVLHVPTKGNMDFGRLMNHIATLIGGASGAIVGALAGAAKAIIDALHKEEEPKRELSTTSSRSNY